MTTLPTDRTIANTAAEHVADHNVLHAQHNALENHASDSTSVHGIADTSSLVYTDDARLSDTRTPPDGSVTNAKVAAGAAIALSKLATDPLARANHTGTQAAATISDFSAAALSATASAYLATTGGTLTGDLVVPDEAYDTTAWNGSLEVPTKNAVRDKIESLSAVATGGANAGDAVLFVSKSGSDSNNGQSWGTAFLTIQKAISSLPSAGMIYVGAGTYQEPFGFDRNAVRLVGTSWGGGTIVERTTDRTMVNLRGVTDTSAANHRRYISIENIQFKDNGVGSNPSNPYFKMHFLSNSAIKDCRFNQIKGVLFSFVEAYDSVFNHLYGVDVGGSDGTKPAIYARNSLDTTTTGLGTITSSGTAVTGTGTYFESWVQPGDTITAGGQTKTVSTVNSDTSITLSAGFSPDVSGATWTVRHNDTSGDNSNNLDFVQLHLESVQDGAIWFVGTSSGSGAMNKCKFTQVKIENRKVQNGTPAVKFHYSNQIHFDDIQITYGAFNTAGSTAVADMIALSNSDGIYFGDAYLESNGSDDCTAAMIHLGGGAKRVSFNAVRWVTANSNLPDWIWKFDTALGTGTNSVHPGLMEQVSGGAAYAPGGANFQSGNPDADLTRYFQDRVQTVTYAASVTPEVYAGEDVKITLTGNITVNKPTKARTSDRILYIFTQDATGGRTVTWGSGFVTSGWSVRSTANAVSAIQFMYDGTNWIQFPMGA